MARRIPAHGGGGRSTACVMGDMDMVRPLELAGIPCAPVALPGDPAHFSRVTCRGIESVDQWSRAEELVERLLGFARRQHVPPVLFYQTDGDLLVASRYRDQLQPAVQLVLADAGLVEDLVDKSRFQQLAERLELGTPRARRVDPANETVPELDLPFPLIAKPLSREMPEWLAVEGDAKAIRIDDSMALRALWPRLARHNLRLLLQELVPGGEDRIESYHAYVDAAGEIAAEFTGCKIRTYPAAYGHSTAVRTTRAADVAARGRFVLQRIGLRGVAKVDFKRGPDGCLHLLEVNPRFSLWHYAGALGGVNIPATVYADLVGAARPASGPVTDGITWCWPWPDRKAAKAAGIPMRDWLPWAMRADAKSVIRWDDPLPFVLGKIWPRVAARRPALERRRPGR